MQLCNINVYFENEMQRMLGDKVSMESDFHMYIGPNMNITIRTLSHLLYL